jgi:hypothetical protein
LKRTVISVPSSHWNTRRGLIVALVGPLWYPSSVDTEEGSYQFEIETGTVHNKTLHYERDLKIESLPHSGELIVTSQLIWKQSIVLYEQQFTAIQPGEEKKLSLVLRTDLSEDLIKSLRNPTDPLAIRLTVQDGQTQWKTDIGPFNLVSRVKDKEAAGKVKKEFKIFPFRKLVQPQVAQQPQILAPRVDGITSIFSQPEASRSIFLNVPAQRETPKRRVETSIQAPSKRRRIESTPSTEEKKDDQQCMSLILDKLDVLEQLQRRMLSKVQPETPSQNSPTPSTPAMCPMSTPSADTPTDDGTDLVFPESMEELGLWFPDDLFEDLAS